MHEEVPAGGHLIGVGAFDGHGRITDDMTVGGPLTSDAPESFVLSVPVVVQDLAPHVTRCGRASAAAWRVDWLAGDGLLLLGEDLPEVQEVVGVAEDVADPIDVRVDVPVGGDAAATAPRPNTHWVPLRMLSGPEYAAYDVGSPGKGSLAPVYKSA
jgi:hypothetical protein